jgi:hypothetical protein
LPSAAQDEEDSMDEKDPEQDAQGLEARLVTSSANVL